MRDQLASQPRLPLLLLGYMLFISVILEWFLFGGPQWLVKIPLLILLLFSSLPAGGEGR